MKTKIIEKICTDARIRSTQFSKCGDIAIRIDYYDVTKRCIVPVEEILPEYEYRWILFNEEDYSVSIFYAKNKEDAFNLVDNHIKVLYSIEESKREVE